MSCTHDCGCSPETRDARTDEWVQIAPESARDATLTPEQPVKAPGQDGDIFLTRGKPVEVEWPNGKSLLRYVDEGGYQLTAGHVGNGDPYPWGVARIVRVLTEDKPTQEPALPRQIKPGDYEVERVAATIHAAVTAAQAINVEAVYRSTGLNLSGGSHDFANIAWDAARAVVRDFDVWLIEDAPAPVDLKGEAVENRTASRHLHNPLRLWRARNGLTVREVADLTGMSPAMISRAERGERSLAPLTKVRIARLLGVPIAELFHVPGEGDACDAR